jgi:glucose/arabinose dehydrogenase
MSKKVTRRRLGVPVADGGADDRTMSRILAPLAVSALLLGAAACSTGGHSSAPSPKQAGSADAAAAAVAGRVRVTVAVPAGLRSAPFDRKRTLLVPRGWKVSVWARVDGARLIVRAPDGRLLVSRPEHGDIVELTPRTGHLPARRTLVSGLHSPHGMAFHGATLFVAETDRLDSFHYAKGRVGARHGLARLPGGGGHSLKSVVVASNGTAYVSIGSSGNISAADRSARPQRATIVRWSPTDHKLHAFARGVRNGTGLALDPKGAVWTAVNNRDQIPYPYHRDWDGDGRSDYGRVMQSYVDDHPLEPVAKLRTGRDLGWPYCDPDPSVKPGVRGSKLAYAKRPFVRDLDTNAGGSHLNCAKLPRIEQGLPAHSAPLGMQFMGLPGLGTGAVIGAHGSWNRQPPRAPAVWFFPWRNGQLGNGRVLISGFQNADGSRWGRTVGVARAKGVLYVTDDQAGAVYRITW